MNSRHLAYLALAPLLLAGCAADDPEQPTSEEITVVTSFYPLQFAAEQIGGDEVNIETLTQPGSEPHDLELSPRQVASIADADLVVYLAGLQPAVDQAVAESQPEQVLEVGSVITQLEESGQEGEHTEGEPAEGEPAEGDGHDHGGQDLHVWLNPENMAAIGDAVAQELTELGGQGDYSQRAEALDSELQELDQRFSDGLAECETRTFVTSHAAFGHLAERYDLEQVSIRGISPDEEPSPARIAEVQQLVRAADLTTIFYETLVSPAVSESVANDLGLRTDVLDPLEGITGDSRGDDYVSVMDANLQALRTANRCQ